MPIPRWHCLAPAAALSLLLALWAEVLPHSARLHPPAGSTAFRSYLFGGRGRMVVYSPRLEGESGEASVIERQLSILHRKFDGLVLYACDGDSDLILRTAESLGFRAVLLTIWSPRSREEIGRAATLVGEHRGRLALAVSIGSEGIMERRYTLADLNAAREQLLHLTAGGPGVETTTTEPWWVYTGPTSEAGSLLHFGDFLTANIHVIWDTDLTSPQMAAQWTAERARELQRAAGRPVLIREAGLPGGGYSPRPESTFEFSRELQYAFWRSWNSLAGEGTPPIVAFEGIDNPEKQWKSFEGSWGLLTPSLDPHPAWEAFPDLVPEARQLEAYLPRDPPAACVPRETPNSPRCIP